MHIQALGGWSVRRDGKPAATGPNQRAVLHALVLSRGEILRDDLERVLPNGNLPRERRQQAIRNALSQLRKLGLAISEHGNPVTMSLNQPQASIDLWEFFAHAALERWDDAAALIARGQEPRLLERGRDDDLWERTLADFARAKRRVMAASATTGGRGRSTRETRERLLGRSLVPGVGLPLSIRDTRVLLEPLHIPWRPVRPAGASDDRSLPEHVSLLLGGPPDAPPRQVLLVGASGAGTTPSAIATFLRLTDRLDRGLAACQRPVLYVDAQVEGTQSGFGTDRWFERRLEETAGRRGSGRPIVIMPHADAFLARHPDELRTILARRAFRDGDVLLCCGEQFYVTRLCYEEYGTHVLQLDPWDAELQEAFALALLGPRVRDAFRAWRGDPTGVRAALCALPLQLLHILPLVGDERMARTIATASQLFEQLARMRLRVAGFARELDELLGELASVAHRFSLAATSERPLDVGYEELREHLRERSPERLRQRTEALAAHTLLTPSPVRDRLCFELPAWERFFAARHLAHTVRYRPGDALRAFAKRFAPAVIELCEQMLREALAHDDDTIPAALRFARWEDEAADLPPGRIAIAHEQIDRLLDAIGDPGAHSQLALLG